MPHLKHVCLDTAPKLPARSPRAGPARGDAPRGALAKVEAGLAGHLAGLGAHRAEAAAVPPPARHPQDRRVQPPGGRLVRTDLKKPL